MEGVQFAQLKFEWLYDILFFVKMQVFLTEIQFFVNPHKNTADNGGKIHENRFAGLWRRRPRRL